MDRTELQQGLAEALRGVSDRDVLNRICTQLRGFVTEQLYLQRFSVVDRISYFKAVYHVYCYLKKHRCLQRERRQDDYRVAVDIFEEIERVEKNLMLMLHGD